MGGKDGDLFHIQKVSSGEVTGSTITDTSHRSLNDLILHSSQGIGNGMVGETDGYLILRQKVYSGVVSGSTNCQMFNWTGKFEILQDLSGMEYVRIGGKRWGFVSHPKGKQ